MNLLQTIRAIEKTAALQPSIGTVVRNDVFRLNAAPVKQYGVFAWLQGEHTTNEESNLISYNFTFFYVDRLTFDHGNEVEVQSVGIETLENILHALPDLGLFPTDYSYRTFNQKFSDECAGVFCNVRLEAAKEGLCAAAFDFVENVGAFNLDFNKDFNCWVWENKERKIFFI